MNFQPIHKAVINLTEWAAALDFGPILLMVSIILLIETVVDIVFEISDQQG